MINSPHRNDPNGREHILPIYSSSNHGVKMPLHTSLDSSNCIEQNSEHSWCCKTGGDDKEAPEYTGNPQCPGEDNCAQFIMNGTMSSSSHPKLALRNSYIGPMTGLRRIPFMLIGFILVGMGAVYTSREAVNSAADQVSILERNRRRMDDKLRIAEKELGLLKREISAMDLILEKQKNLDSVNMNTIANNVRAVKEMNSLQERLKDEVQQAEALKRKVQIHSLAEVNAKYGVGVHHVEIELIFPDRKEGATNFILELAPTELMPHSTQTFLEMVSTGLLDGCSFILNALHVIKAAPLPYDGSSAKEKAKAFSKHGLESVAFREYSDRYPHQKYTIGFAADGSPSFYINTEDNSAIHVGDPCFGKVISGFDAIKRLESMPTRNGIWFERRIGIKKATILDESKIQEHLLLRTSRS